MWGLSILSWEFPALLLGFFAVMTLYVSGIHASRRIAEANERASAADERAAKAEQRAAEANLEVARLTMPRNPSKEQEGKIVERARPMWRLSILSWDFLALLLGVFAVMTLYVSAIHASRQIAEANERASAADERAAKAEQRAAEANLEVTRLRAPRNFSKEQEGKIVEALRKFPPLTYDLSEPAMLEPGSFLDAQLIEIFTQLGWTFRSYNVYRRASDKINFSNRRKTNTRI